MRIGIFAEGICADERETTKVKKNNKIKGFKLKRIFSADGNGYGREGKVAVGICASFFGYGCG